MHKAEKGRVVEAKALLGQVRSAQMRYSAERAKFTGATADLDLTFQTPRYFDISAVGGGDISLEATVAAKAVRNAIDNPGMGSYAINISQAGTMTGDATAALVM